MIHDTGKVIAGLVVFVALVSFPFWFTLAGGKAGDAPELQKATGGGGKCIEDTEYMRAYHMDFLNQWRDAVVREGERVYVSKDGRKHEMSLSSTCLSCHASKTQFCDKCHDYVGVQPYCWDCHVSPDIRQHKG